MNVWASFSIAASTIKRCGVWSVCGIAAVAIVAGCNRSPGQLQGWSIYRNSRYDFQFPYPQDWTRVLSPSNQDGQAFSNPDNQDVQVRGWASQLATRSTTTDAVTASPTATPTPNFTTEQGLAGQLDVAIGAETSSMTLTLRQDDVMYYWQGRSPSEDFTTYYPLFSYMAQHYRITESKDPQ